MSELIIAQIQQALTEITPYIQQDGGDLSFVDFDAKTGVVTVQMHGACVGCGLSQVTLKAGVERLLKAKLPNVTSVRAV